MLLDTKKFRAYIHQSLLHSHNYRSVRPCSMIGGIASFANVFLDFRISFSFSESPVSQACGLFMFGAILLGRFLPAPYTVLSQYIPIRSLLFHASPTLVVYRVPVLSSVILRAHSIWRTGNHHDKSNLFQYFFSFHHF